jgi:hypothetical protein
VSVYEPALSAIETVAVFTSSRTVAVFACASSTLRK